jgi:hypothetical protein
MRQLVVTRAFHRLREFEGRPGVSVGPKGQALELTLVRDDVEVRVLVPEAVLEWFVEAERPASGSKASDWCDYEGYDDTPVADLVQAMAEEVATFVNQLIERDLRYTDDKKRPAQGVLEWLVNGQWHQALPFGVPAA